MDINRFTEKSREALTTAQGLAAQYGHQEVDAEHLALALVNQEDGFVPRVLERVGVAPKALVTALEAVLKKRPSVRGPGCPTPRVRRARSFSSAPRVWARRSCARRWPKRSLTAKRTSCAST